MEYTIASLAHRATITREIIAHCAGLRAVGRERLAETIESGDINAHLSHSRDVVNGLYRLRSVLEHADDDAIGTVGDKIADIESAFSIMLRCTRDGIVTDGTDNATYAAARLEVSRKWVAVDDAIDALRSGR